MVEGGEGFRKGLSCLLFEVGDSVPLRFSPTQIFAANANYITSDMPLSVV